jgi:hypothetical protein
MVARHWNYRFARLSVLAVALAAAGWLAIPAAASEELDKLDASLKLIPEDAAFYSTNLRNREQFEALRNSNAWAKIEQMPVVQMGLSFYNTQLGTPGSGPAKFQAALKNPETRKIVDLLVGMVSDEVFIYGDDSCIDLLELAQNIGNAVNYGPMVMQATGQANGQNPNQLQAKMVLSSLAKNSDLIGMPNFVVGFKLKNADLAKEQLIKLEAIANILLEANEKTQGHFKKTKVGDYDYLVLELDGQMIPWDEVPIDKFKEMELEEGDAEKVIDQLKESKLVLALGVRDDYLMAMVGSSLECLENLGQDERLIDRPEFAPLEQYVEKRLTSIGYISEEMNQHLNNQEKGIDELLTLVDKLLPLAKLSEEQNDRIRKDAEDLAEEVKGLVPQVGAVMGLSFLSDRGIEGYQYAWGDHGRSDGSKQLDLLQHVGGNPILGIVSRGKVNIDDYDRMVKWAQMGYGYFEEFGLPAMKENDREKLKSFLDSAMPLVERMDKANRDMLFPALADGQSALVIDGKLQSKHFIESLPETEEAMPMVEPAMVMGVSDAKLLKEGLSEYREIINGLIDAMRQVEGVDVREEIQIPEPQVAESSKGTIYSFALPKDWGVDEQIAPQIGISDEVAVVALSKDHAERLLTATPLAVGGVLEETERPLATAAWLNWAALVETATPWVDFAVEKTMESKGVDESEQETIVDQVHTGLEVLKALRAISIENYLEDDVLVHHTLLEIHDVEK